VDAAAINFDVGRYPDQVRQGIEKAIRYFQDNKAAIIKYKEDEYDPKDLSRVNTYYGMLRYSQDPPRYMFLNHELIRQRLEAWENELEDLFNTAVALSKTEKDLFVTEERRDREKRYKRAFMIGEEIKGALNNLQPGRSAEIDEIRERLIRAQWYAKRLSKEFPLISLHKQVSVIPYEQLNRFGEGDTGGRNNHIGLYPGLYLTDGLALSEAQNPKGHKQNNHQHEGQELTIALYGDIRIARVGNDGKDREVLPVPAGYMIKISPNTVHRIDNPNKNTVSADFTIKSPLVQLQKSFEYTESSSAEAVRVIAPVAEELNDSRGKVFTYFYPGQAHILDVDPITQQMNLNSNNLPHAKGDAYFKVKVIYLKAGMESDEIEIRPLYGNFQAIRVFPWPDEIGTDWVLEKDRKNLNGKIAIINQNSHVFENLYFEGGDLIVIRSQQSGQDNQVASRFKIKNSGQGTLIFVMLERMEDDERLSSNFLKTLTPSEKIQNLVSLSFSVLEDHRGVVNGELADIYNGLCNNKIILQDPLSYKYLQRLVRDSNILAGKLADDAEFSSGVQKIKEMLGKMVSLKINKNNYYWAVFIDPDLLRGMIAITPLLKKYSEEYFLEWGRFPTLDEVKDYIQNNKDVLALTNNRKVEQIPDLVLLSDVLIDRGAEDRIGLAQNMFHQIMTVSPEHLDEAIRRLRNPTVRRSTIIALKWLANTAELDNDEYRTERDRARKALTRFSEMFFSEFEGKKMIDAFSIMVKKRIVDSIKQGLKSEEILVVPLLTSGEQLGQYVANRIKDTEVATRPLLFTTAMTIAFGKETNEKTLRANVFTPQGKENALRYLRQERILDAQVKQIFFIDTGMTGSFGKLLNFTLKDSGVNEELLLFDHADYEQAGIGEEWAHGLNDEEDWKGRQDDILWMCIMLDHVFEHSEESPSHIIGGISGGEIRTERRPSHHPWFVDFVKHEFDRVSQLTVENNAVNEGETIKLDQPLNASIPKLSPDEISLLLEDETDPSAGIIRTKYPWQWGTTNDLESSPSYWRSLKQMQQIELALSDMVNGQLRAHKHDTDLKQLLTKINSEKGVPANFKGEEVHVLSGTGPDARVIGRIDRKIAESFGYSHETANVIIEDPDGKIILQLRNKENFDNHLCVYGGHLGVGEAHEAAAIEEAEQESGITAGFSNPIEFIGQQSYDFPGDNNRERRSWFRQKLTKDEWETMKVKKAEDERAVDADRNRDDYDTYKWRLASLWGKGKGEVILVTTIDR